MMIRRTVIAVVALVACTPLFVAAPAPADTAHTYTAPYELGPAIAGDQFNVSQVDPNAGSITLARAYPVPATISCGGQAPSATFAVHQVVTGPVTSVTVNYSNAAYDDFTFLDVTLTDLDAAGNIVARLGALSTRGPVLAPSGSVTLTYADPSTDPATHFWQQPVVDPQNPHEFLVVFGIHLSSACLPAQSADAGTVTFASVTVA